MKKIILIAVLIVPMTLWFTAMLTATILELLCESMMGLADTIESKINNK